MQKFVITGWKENNMGWSNYNCPVCDESRTIYADGPEGSDILILGEWCVPKAEELELAHGRSFVSQIKTNAYKTSGTTVGTVLNQLFRYNQWNILTFRKMYMWHHAPPTITKKKGPEKIEQEKRFAECYAYAKNLVLKGAIGKQAILLIGPVVTKEYTGYNVSDVCGINVTSEYFSAPIIVPCYNINAVFKSQGEVKTAIKKFCGHLETL